MDISKGIIEINGIEIKYTDTLTDVLKKTDNLLKQIRNNNNFQLVYFENSVICKYFTNCCLIFSELGILKEVKMGFSMNDKNNYLKKPFIKFLRSQKCENNYVFENGSIQLECEPHFMEYYIKIAYK